MPVPSAMVTRFFQLILTKQFAEAERELERIKQKMHKTEWNRGYFRALYGMLLVRKSNNNDSYAFFAKLDLKDKEALQTYRREFLEHVRNRLHGDFDRGFFAAWADFTRVAGKLTINETQSGNVFQEEEKDGEEPLKDNQQSTMEDFLE
ncbi:MAG: hypothetical protein NZ932_02755 [Candidatus Bathyarchaeota archaeon]|nr:hypothetical protein [Candidatus Bathyarchaeota archaeon]MDW8041151.1 hypothetical protein [Nitrososphaerota archaeon]